MFNNRNNKKNNEDTKEFATIQLRVPRDLWKQFKHKAIDNDKTCSGTLIELVQKHVQR